MASISLEDVELGFAENPGEHSGLSSLYFPSKIGGKPAWLDPVGLLPPEDLVCRKCSKPRVLLLQVYAPIDDLTHCYHRTLYIFCCKEPSCHSRNYPDPFLVLRCNLPKANSFYDLRTAGVVDGEDMKDNDGLNNSTSIDEHNTTLTVRSEVQDVSVHKVTMNNSGQTSDNVTFSVNDNDISDGALLVQDQQPLLDVNLYPPLCVVCGCSGPKRCAKCHRTSYCSREHQVIHWKAGHKKQCGDEKQPTTNDILVGNEILFEEFEIVTEPEPPIKVTPEKSEEERVRDYHKFLEQHSGKSDTAKMDKLCLDEVEKEVKNDKQFMIFKERVEVEPDQVYMSVEHRAEMNTVWLEIKGFDEIASKL